MSTVTLQELIERVANSFQDADLVYGQGSDDAWQEAAWISLTVIGEDLVEPGQNWERMLSTDEIEEIESQAVRRIETRKPFAYLFNQSWFAGEKFYVDGRVIIPRSYLSEWIPEQFEPWIDSSRVGSILDLCTGCGCIAITAAKAFEQARVMASDLSAEALEVAAINVEAHGLKDRIELNRGDLFDGINRTFDLILCNPPYVSMERMGRLPAEYRHEPDLAFAAGQDGLSFINRLLLQAAAYLNGDGVLVVEAGSASSALEEQYPQIPFTWLSTAHDEMVVFLISAKELGEYRGKLESGSNQSSS